MDSPVKEKTFLVDEEKKPVSRMSSRCAVILLLVIAVVFISAAAVAIAVGVGVSVSKASKPANRLTIINLRPEVLHGEYRDGSHGGIRFYSTVNSSHIDLSVTTTSGDTVVNILHPANLNMTMIGVNSTTFLVMDNQYGHKYFDLIVPENFTNTMTSIMAGELAMSEGVLEQLDNDTVNETRQSSLQELTMRHEALLIIEAANALGSRGVQGTEYPAAMTFYQLALRISIIRDHTEEAASNSATDGKANESGQKRSGLVKCTYGGGSCRRNACPSGRQCHGMCGRRCTCWSYVCGDCCVHRYCLTHDQCCIERGFYSWACLSVAWKPPGTWWGPSCSDKYDC